MVKKLKHKKSKPNEPKTKSKNGTKGKKPRTKPTLKKQLEFKALARAKQEGKNRWLYDNPKLKKKLTEHTAYKNKDRKEGKAHRAVFVKKFTLLYEDELKKLQIELLKLQKQIKADGLRVMALFEGRDAAGKGGTIKRVTEHLNPRGTRVVALGVPSNTEKTQWYFQRYITHFPSAGEIVLFDRSWYNRAIVEPVMGFCTDEQNKRFLKDCPLLEEMIVKDGIKLFKFFFSVTKDEQLRRFDSRETDPLKQYKISPVDRLAQEMWDDYTLRKFVMLNETNRTLTPWTIIRSDNKKLARLNCIKFMLNHFDYEGKISDEELRVDPEIVVSGIDEIRLMEEGLLTPLELPG